MMAYYLPWFSLLLLFFGAAAYAQEIDDKALIKAHRLKYAPSKEPDTPTESLTQKEKITFSGEHINTDLEVFVDSLTRQYYRIKTVPGYRILVYNGNEREQANAVKKRVYTLYDDADVYIQFKQPTFRVLVGDFEDKLMCLQFLQQLKTEFPQAVMLSEVVNIKR